MKRDTFCDLLIARLLDIFCLRPEHRANVPWHGSIASPDRCAQQGPDDEIIWRYKLMIALPTPGRGSHGFCQVCTKLGRINDSATQQNLYVWVLLFPFVGFLVNKVANYVCGRQLSAIGKYTFHIFSYCQSESDGISRCKLKHVVWYFFLPGRILPLRQKGNLLLCTILLGNTAVNAAMAQLLLSSKLGMPSTYYVKKQDPIHSISVDIHAWFLKSLPLLNDRQWVYSQSVFIILHPTVESPIARLADYAGGLAQLKTPYLFGVKLSVQILFIQTSIVHITVENSAVL